MSTKNYLATVLLLLCLYATKTTNAQTTGSFDTSITFMGGLRAVSLYVPPAYNAAVPHRLMICLHGLGDTCNNYRSSLMFSLGWAASIPNTIFVCPESYNRNTDFFLPAGSDAIIEECISMATSLYHIDTADIILQGFSLGGRAALRYGLDNPTTFKGLLLNTPAIQGVKEGINAGTYHFNFAGSAHIPIYITHGQDDVLYSSPIDSAIEQMILQNGLVRYYDVAGLAHAIPPVASLLNLEAYFNTPTVPGYDLDVVKVSIAQRSCVATLPATCLVRNTGANIIHTITLNYTVAGTTLTTTWTGSLSPFDHAVISLPVITAPAGNQSLTVAVASLETGIADTFTANNTKMVPFQVATTGTPLPLAEGFEGAFPPANWVQYLAGDMYTPWDRDNTVKKTGLASMSAFNTIFIFNNVDRKEELAAPVLDFAAATHPHLTFDLAFNYHHYMPPVTLIDTVFADTLAVLVSADCGETFTTLYKKGGSELATFPAPILNPLNIDADFIHPAAANWRTEDIDLSAYAGNDKVIVKFSYRSALGGSINIDNVNFLDGGLAVSDISTDVVNIFPNPASDVVNISCPTHITDVSVTDIAGRVVYAQTGNNSSTAINTATFTSGIYVFRIVTGESVIIRKVVIAH